MPKPTVRDSAGRYSGTSTILSFDVIGFPAAVIPDVKTCGWSVNDFHVPVWQEMQDIKKWVVVSSG